MRVWGSLGVVHEVLALRLELVAPDLCEHDIVSVFPPISIWNVLEPGWMTFKGPS